MALTVPVRLPPLPPSPASDHRPFPLLRRTDAASAHSAAAVASNALLAARCKSGDPAGARQPFDAMSDRRDLVAWTAIASSLARNGRQREALSLLVQMLRGTGLLPNGFTLCAAFLACSVQETFDAALAVLGQAVKLGFWGTDAAVACSMIDMFAKNGELNSARKVFDALAEKNVVVWTLMITRYGQSGYAKSALELFLAMMDGGFLPDQFTVSAVTSPCSELGDIGLGKQLHSYAVRTGLVADVCIGCGLVDMYAKLPMSGSVERAMEVFEQMTAHNVMSWTAIISACIRAGKDGDAIGLFREMLHGDVQPNHLTYSGVLKACGGLTDASLGKQVHAAVAKSGLELVDVVGNALVGMYAHSGHMKASRTMFDRLCKANLGSDIAASAFTFASLLSSAATVGSMTRGQLLHALTVKTGLARETVVGNSVVAMYSRCGDINDARRAFDDMEARNVISWTSMITGYAKHGCAEKTLQLFADMVTAGIRPNEVTYIAVLSACSHVGLVHEAWRHFNSMTADHGLVPRMDHYACMVDLLGRSGRLDEAIEFIYAMPFRANALIWKTLLSACTIHGEVELGELAAEQVRLLDLQDPAPYVLLSNLYANAGKWEAVAKLRSEMKGKRLTKEAGLSWVEDESRGVSEFHAGDTRHPEAEAIYAKLHMLLEEIKAMGYVPDTGAVLHDVEEAAKERCLALHSEKIAVAFGLLSTPPGKTVRVMKNLRVCRDCHGAMKLMSRAAGREIVVRDAGRFHRMKDGICSCGDYW